MAYHLFPEHPLPVPFGSMLKKTTLALPLCCLAAAGTTRPHMSRNYKVPSPFTM